MFRQSVLGRRCVFPTTGFYEWGHGGGQKRKYRFQLPGPDRALYLAGLWNDYAGQRRCVILTTAANGSMAEIHDRMPLILTGEQRRRWLADTDAAAEILAVVPPELVRTSAESQISLW